VHRILAEAESVYDQQFKKNPPSKWNDKGQTKWNDKGKWGTWWNKNGKWQDNKWQDQGSEKRGLPPLANPLPDPKKQKQWEKYNRL